MPDQFQEVQSVLLRHIVVADDAIDLDVRSITSASSTDVAV